MEQDNHPSPSTFSADMKNSLTMEAINFDCKNMSDAKSSPKWELNLVLKNRG